MRPLLLLLTVWVGLSCQRAVEPTDQLYGKWLLAGGSALPKRQTTVNPKPIYFTFSPTGRIDYNGSNCQSFTFGKAGELLVTNHCIDCATEGCNESIWHYTFNSANELTIEFQTGDIGWLRRQ